MTVELTQTSLSEPPHASEAALPSPGAQLRKLFLTLFLRGRTSRGLQKKTAPTSIGRKLAMTLVYYALFGLIALPLMRQSIFALSVYLHAMTFVFLGMFVAASAGEILFNKEEADILLHRPIEPRTLLFAKTRVLVEVSLWLAMAFNLVGLFAGSFSVHGGWRFPVAHIASTVMEALFCTSCVILVYQLCLRWFGRERLDGLMTTAQVLVAVVAVGAGQVFPQLLGHGDKLLSFNADAWWIALLPPAWFAGFDDAIVSGVSRGSWLLAGFAVVATFGVLAIAFGKLAGDYQRGLQNLSDTVAVRKPTRTGRRWIDRLVNVPPLSWWLRDPVMRASFLLCTAYLVRDRDMKLRFYPGIAPMLIMPVIMLMQGSGHQGGGGGFPIAFLGAFFGLIPLLGVTTLQFSQQWQAADVFRAAPMRGPAALCAGARCAILFFITFPLIVVFASIALFAKANIAILALMLPGIIAMPIYAMVPNIGGRAVPLSQPTEDAKAARRGTMMIGVMFISFILAGISAAAWEFGFFRSFLAIEAVAAVVIYLLLKRSVANVRWGSLE